MKWKYVIDLSDADVFSRIEEQRNVTIPNELKKFIKETNAGTPENNCIMLDGKERILGAVLCFNEDENEADSVFVALSVIKEKKQLPFGIDPFGNLFCLDLDTKFVTFWDHEKDRFSNSGLTLKAFISSLYIGEQGAGN